MISFDDILETSSRVIPQGLLTRTKCFICKKDFTKDKKVIQLAQLKRGHGMGFTYDAFNTHAKIVLIHIECFATTAGDEFLFE